jgi:SHAQKYF class myb-like DNA-binding protein
MNESGSKSSEDCPPATKLDDDKANDTAGGKTDSNVQQSATVSVGGSTNTISVRAETDEKDHATQESITSSKYHSSKMTTTAITHKEPTDDSKGKGNENKAKESMDIQDAIADIAASTHIQSRRKKQERSDRNDTPQQTSPPTNNHVPIVTHPPTIVTATMSNHYVPPRLQMGMGSLKNNASTRTKSNDKNFAGSSNGPKTKVSVHMLNSVGLECGDDGMLRLEHFDDDESASMCANDADAVGPMKIEDGSGEEKNTAVKNGTKLVTWTLEEHKAFAAAIFEIGLKNCSPSIIMENMRKQPRYITRERTKSHLQKYRQTKERSKAEFLKEFDAFFNSTDQAKALLNCKNSSSQAIENDESAGTTKNLKRKEPVPKAILTTALEGKKPSKLLGGKAAALLSYSVLNGFSTSHGPDQLQYKAAKFTEFPSMTEEEKRSSVGASLLQVKSLIDNMTDVLLKTRHGIKPFPVRGSGIGDDESLSSSLCSSDDGYSDEDDDNVGGGTRDKHLIGKTGSKEQDPTVVPTVPPKVGGPFPMGAVPGGPLHPLYRGPPPTAYPAPFPAPGAPPPVATSFPPPQYPPPQPPSFYGGAPPPPHLQPTSAPGYGAPAGFHHPQMHYSQDPRISTYQQPPPTQVASYPGVPPMQPNYYSTVPGYPAYYGSASESNITPVAGNVGAEYPPRPSATGDVFATHSRHGGEEQQQRPNMYDQQSPSYPNDSSRGRSYDANSSERRGRKRSEKRSKHSRRREDRETPLSVDTSELQRAGDNDFGDFLDRLSKIPSPEKAKSSSSSPVQRSRRPLHSEDVPMDKQSRKRSRSSELQKSRQSQNRYSEGGVVGFSGSYEVSPIHRGQSHPSQNQARVDQQHHPNSSGQFWESSNFEEASYNSNQQQSQTAGSVGFHQHPAQLDGFGSGGADNQQQTNSMYYKSAQSSPDTTSTTNFFYGE